MCRAIVHKGGRAIRVDGIYPTVGGGAHHFWATVEQRPDMSFAEASLEGMNAIEQLAADMRRSKKED